jgi:gliding motility-associated-like protein
MNYTVIGADVNGCKDTAVSTVIVNPLPTVLVNSPTICAGLTASLNANGAASYTWTSGLPPNASVNTPILYFSDSYTVTGTDANGCQNSATSIITVNPKPNVTVNSPTICEGEFTTLTAAGALSYTWTGGLPNGAVVTTPALSTTMAYFVYGTDGNGCTNAARSVVTVNPIRSTSLIQAICQGESVTVGPRTFTTTGNYTVGLTTSLGCDSVITLDLTVNPVKTTNLRQTLCEGQFATVGGQTFLQSGIYTVELQTSNSCDSTVILDLTVKPNLLVEVDLVASQNNICYGTPVTFTATPRNGGTAPQFQWYMNSTPFGTNTNIFSSSTLNNLDQLQVTLVSSEMCVQNTPAFSPTIPMTVYRLDYIKPVIEYCTGDSRILDLSIPQTDYTIVWRNDNFIRTTQNTDELEINNTSSGFVDFTIQFGLNCTKHDTVNITVNPLPAVGLSVDEDTVRYGDTVQLTGIMPIPANTFSWTPATVNTTTILNPTAEVLAPTSFILEVTDIKGCRNRASVFVELLDECNSNYVFIPNAFTPNRDGLNDCFGAVDVSPHTDFHLVVFNRWGERLYESYDATQCWDGIYKGSDALMDTYPYVVTYRCYNGKFVEKHGILTLIR